MADIWKAYQFLNESLNLNLDRDTLYRMEAAFKEGFLREKGYSEEIIRNPTDWEFFAYLAPADRQRGK